ncbi:hypothetical protein JCM24511_09134 [Saitozyma sp. JCM 24511]|nr:hypothetical protein JCM24511_09134 [Saitozyma sp. JCM 24511]
MGAYKTIKPYAWKWDPTVLLHGPPGGACGKSEYGDGSLIPIGRRKTPTIVTPETICNFTSQTLEQLGLDPMYPAAVCSQREAHQEAARSPQRGPRILGHDPDGKLYHEAVNVWESPAQVTKRTADAAGAGRDVADDGFSPSLSLKEIVKAVPDKKGIKGPLTPAELAVLDTIVVEWKKLVPFANEDDMAVFFLQPSTVDESRNARPLVEAFLVTIHYPSHTHQQATSLENELQRAILEGKAFRQSRFAYGSLYRASRAMTANFATNSSDRQALLRAYREVSQDTGASFADMTLDIVEQGKSKKNQSSAFFHSLAWKYNPACTINERNAIIASIKSWAKGDKLGQVQYHSWTPREDLACFELGFSDHAVVAEELRAHGMNPSLIAVTFRVSRRGSIAIPAVDRLRRSCPRWWKAMGLPATGKEAVEGAIVRGAASGASIGETKAGIDQVLFNEDTSATYFPTNAELAGSDAGFESYLRRREVLESGKTQAELLQVAQTKTAILRRVRLPD